MRVPREYRVTIENNVYEQAIIEFDNDMYKVAILIAMSFMIKNLQNATRLT